MGVSRPMLDADPLALRLGALALKHRARRLEDLARTVVDGDRPGEHRSRARGDGVDFAEHRPYAAGDDLRTVDWRTSARHDRVVVRRFDAARSTAMELLVDVSRSMEFGSVSPGDPLVSTTKSEAAVMAAAVYGLSALRLGDPVTLSLVGETPQVHTPRRGEAQLAALCTDLAQALPAAAPSAALDDAVARATTRLRRPGRVIVITDALDEDLGWLGRLTTAATRGHGVAVIQVVDPAEQDLSHDRAAEFEDPETGRRLATDPDRVRRLYCSLFDGFVEDVRAQLLRARGDHVLQRVGEPPARPSVRGRRR